MATKVKFLYHETNDEVLAFFPEMDWNLKGEKTCYAHIGQHGACCIEYAQDSRDATQEEREELHKELVAIGYNDLEVLN